MFQTGTERFIGGKSAKKYINLTGCSKATATRDLTDLVNKGCL
jgi:Fic family protein